MEAIDSINGRHGRHTIRPLAMNYRHPWAMRQERLSRRYTTRWGRGREPHGDLESR